MKINFWPEGDFDFSSLVTSSEIREIEGFLEDIYAPYRVILFSSARAALSAIIEVEKLSKKNLLGIPKFSSTCVIHAVTGFTQVTPFYSTEPDMYLVYHQMGVPYKIESTKKVIEDSADSLCLDASALFQNNSSYEVFSLPKIIGSKFGGMVVVKNDKEASELEKIRNTRDKYVLFFDLLRAGKKTFPLGELLWEGACTRAYGTSRIARADISSKLLHWKNITDQRLRRMETVEKLNLNQWQLSTGRLLCCLPVNLERVSAELKSKYPYLIRNLYIDQTLKSQEMKQFFLLPLHQHCPDQFFDFALKEMK